MKLRVGDAERQLLWCVYWIVGFILWLQPSVFIPILVKHTPQQTSSPSTAGTHLSYYIIVTNEANDMPNQLTTAGDGLALQVTGPARSAGLVEEDADGTTTHRAAVVAYGFDDYILVIDRDTDRVPMADRVELVTRAAAETESIHRGIDTKIQHSGNGYRVQVPTAGTGFAAGDGLPCHAAPGLLVMAPLDAPVRPRRLLETRRTQAADSDLE